MRAAEKGHHGVDASIFAVQMVLKPLVASVFVTMIAFSPMMLFSGDVRQFTMAISMVVMSTLVFSLIESLIILPAHLAHATLPSEQEGLLREPRLAFQQRCARSVVWVAETCTARWSARREIPPSHLGSVPGDHDPRRRPDDDRAGKADIHAGSRRRLHAGVDHASADDPFSRMEQVAEQLDGAPRVEEQTRENAVEDQNTGQLARRRAFVSQSIEENSIRAYVGLTPPETARNCALARSQNGWSKCWEKCRC